MPLERTYILIKSLNKKEKVQLNSVIEFKKKESLKKLHFIVENQKSNKIIRNKALIYSKIFGEKYQKEKDYLLRNEIRLYNKEIKKIIATSGLLNNDFSQNLLFIQELEGRNVKELVQTELKKAIAVEENKEEYGNAAELLNLLSNNTRKQQQYTSKYFSDWRHQLLTEYAYRKKEIIENISDIACRMAFVERVLNQLSQEKEYMQLDKPIDLQQKEYNTVYANFNFLKAKSYKEEGKRKIAILSKIGGLLDNQKHPKIDAQRENILNNNAIATTYLLIGNYTEANAYFEKCIAQKEKISTLEFKQILHNYLSALSKSKNYEKARAIVESNSSILENLSIQDRFLPLVISIYVLCGDFQKAESLMPINLKSGDFDSYHYYRILLCIIYYENDDIDLAANEARNFSEHLRTFRDKTNPLDIEISNLVIQYINIEYKYIDSNKEKKLKNLQQRLDDLSRQYKKFSRDSLILMWLKKQFNL